MKVSEKKISKFFLLNRNFDKNESYSIFYSLPSMKPAKIFHLRRDTIFDRSKKFEYKIHDCNFQLKIVSDMHQRRDCLKCRCDSKIEYSDTTLCLETIVRVTIIINKKKKNE